jgi:hypothetical protein
LLTSAERGVLGELRVLPLVEKMRGVVLAQLIRRKLDREDLDLEVSLSNSIGLVPFYSRPLAHGHQVGWQLQGGQFRLAVATRQDARFFGRSKRPAREALVASEYAEHFSFDLLPRAGDVLGPPTARKPWLGYNPDFVYRYRPLLSEASWRQVVDLCSAGVLHSDR